MIRPGFRIPVALCLASLLLVLGGCFENPVRRVLGLSFAENGDLEISLRIDLLRRTFASQGEKDRMALEEEKLLGPDNLWQRRFGSLEGRVEDVFRRREEGQLTRLVRRAEVEHNRLRLEDGPLAAFWAGSTIFPVYDYDPVSQVAEFALYPGKADRAGYREQRRVDDQLAEWSTLIYAYLQDMETLFAYLERRPDRAETLFAAFGDETDDLQVDDEELLMLEALQESMFEVLAPFEATDETDSETWDELSRRVFDPFAARLVVDLPGRPLESEGFVEQGGRWVVPGLSLWTAWQELSETWISPNLLMVLIDVEQEFGGLGQLKGRGPSESESGSEVELDFSALAAQPRRAELPFDAVELEERLRSELRPHEVYRLRWRVPQAEPASN